MKTIILIKEIYLEGFRDLGNFVVKHYFKAFALFTLGMFVLVFYAFMFRLLTGFAFD